MKAGCGDLTSPLRGRTHRNRTNIFSRPQLVDLATARESGDSIISIMPAIDVVPSSLPANGYGRSALFEDDEDDFDL